MPWDKYAAEAFDDDDRDRNAEYRRRDDEYDEQFDREPRELKCRRCGSTEVRWRMQTGKWTLFALEPGKLHVCELDDSAFGVVPE